ncbi:MAG: hypothetical protein IKI30_03800 [Oxalobacter sp.]|nr:hypothetical protein [Oxalobacter sp.]
MMASDFILTKHQHRFLSITEIINGLTDDDSGFMKICAELHSLIRDGLHLYVSYAVGEHREAREEEKKDLLFSLRVNSKIIYESTPPKKEGAAEYKNFGVDPKEFLDAYTEYGIYDRTEVCEKLGLTFGFESNSESDSKVTKAKREEPLGAADSIDAEQKATTVESNTTRKRKIKYLVLYDEAVYLVSSGLIELHGEREKFIKDWQEKLSQIDCEKDYRRTINRYIAYAEKDLGKQ